jgi:hypothetical protein
MAALSKTLPAFQNPTLSATPFVSHWDFPLKKSVEGFSRWLGVWLTREKIPECCGKLHQDAKRGGLSNRRKDFPLS